MNGPFLLVVIDGFGVAPAGEGNAISRADTPCFDRLYGRWPSSRLEASGRDVGLPAGVMGNSEVGHLNIGAGRVVPQDLVRIGESIASGAYFDNEAFVFAVGRAADSGGRLHLMGLYSDGNVHSSDEHVHALVDLAARTLPPDRIYVHVMTDGRDTPPRSAGGYVDRLAAHVRGKATLATVSGRYYAMDRDQRWERTELAFRAIAGGQGLHAADAAAAVRAAYERDEGDEFIRPTVLDQVRAPAAGDQPLICRGDAVVFWNFRADRARQLCSALMDPAFEGFDRGDHFAGPGGLTLVSMTQYAAGQPYRAAFPPSHYSNLLAHVWSANGVEQLRIAETEKYAHVTYFFNGGEEKQLPGEHRILVPSPKVATYDLQPEMSAPEVTGKLLAEIRGGTFGAAVLNLANPDMVGHTGIIPATVAAIEVVDRSVGVLVDAILAKGGTVAITADHGNAEQMLDPSTGQPHTAHTTNPVPLLVCGAPDGAALRSGGRLADVAPTILDLMGLPQPASMTGRSLVTAP